MKKLFLIALFCLNLPTMISLGKYNIGIIEVLAQSQGENNNWENWSGYGGSISDGTLNGGSLPEVTVTGTYTSDNSVNVSDTYLDIYNTINGGNALGEGNEVVCYGEKPSGSGGSNGSTGSPTTPNINVTPDNPKKNDKDIVFVDCDTFEDEFSAAKSEVSSVIDKFYQAKSGKIGKNQYLSREDYIKIVCNDEQNEYATLLRDYGEYGVFLTDTISGGTNNTGPFMYGINSDTYKAIFHNHPNASSLSAQDIIALLKAHFSGCNNLNSIIAWNTNCDDYYYCATIVSEEKARKFLEKYGEAVDKDNHNWVDEDIENFYKSYENEFDSINYSWDDNIEALYRLQAVLDNFDAGISLTTVWFDGEKNNITSIKTLKQDDEGKLQFFRCGDFY